MGLQDPITGRIDLWRLERAGAVVRRGARVLDKMLPYWRRVMRKHDATFNFADGDFCVLGTLEHRSGLRRLRKHGTTEKTETGYHSALKRLRISEERASEFGFDTTSDGALTGSATELEALWRAEYMEGRDV